MDQPDNVPDHTTKIMVVVSIFCVILMGARSFTSLSKGRAHFDCSWGKLFLIKIMLLKIQPGVHLMIPFINQVNTSILNCYTPRHSKYLHGG